MSLRAVSAVPGDASGGVTSLNGEAGAITITGSDGTVLVTSAGTNIDLKVSSTSEVVSLNGLMGALTLANANGVSWTASGGNTLTPVLGNITPTSVTATGAVSGSTLSGTNIGSATLADASTQPLILSGGSTPTAGNLVGLAIEKSGFEEVFLGVNKNTATGAIAANSLYLSTYTATGRWAIGRGNGAGLPNTADIGADSSGNITIPQNLIVSGTINTVPISAQTITRAIGITIDGGGSVITTGNKGYIYVPYGCTITAATMVADQSGSAVVDVWSSAYPTVPTVSNTITASDLPTLSSSQVSQDTTLTGWTKTIAAGSVIGFNVNSAATVTRVNLTLTVQTT